MEERVAVREVSKAYRLGTLTVQALSRVTPSIGAGEFMAIAGPSGCGRTTLLNLIGRDGPRFARGADREPRQRHEPDVG